MELHYDFPNNQASFFISRNGVQSRLLYNFPRYEKYFIQGLSEANFVVDTFLPVTITYIHYIPYFIF